MNLKRFLILTLLACPLMADGNPFEVALTATIANGDLNKMVRSGNLAGYTVGFAARQSIKPGLNTRLHLSFMSLRGLDKTGLQNANRPHINGGLDIMQDTGNWTFFGGMTASQWKQNLNGATNPMFIGTNASDGVKFGFRVGAEYAFSKELRGQFAFNQAEFNKVLNPSWYSLGVVYRFQ